MEIRISEELTDRRGNSTGATLGQTIVNIIDTISVAGVKAAGNPRLLARVAERIDDAVEAKRTANVEVNPEEEKTLRAAIEASTNMQFFMHRRIMAMLWPGELEDDERKALLNEPPAKAPNNGTGKTLTA